MDVSNLGSIIRERRDALGLPQSRFAHFSGLSRQTLVGLEAGASGDMGLIRVAQLLAVPGLDLDPPSRAARARKRALWMAAKNASVSCVQEVAEIRQACQERVGKAVAPSTIYRLLDRHGWRKVVPRPRHPKAGVEAQAASACWERPGAAGWPPAACGPWSAPGWNANASTRPAR